MALAPLHLLSGRHALAPARRRQVVAFSNWTKAPSTWRTRIAVGVNNWLTNNFTLEIIRAKVAANKANAILNV